MLIQERVVYQLNPIQTQLTSFTLESIIEVNPVLHPDSDSEYEVTSSLHPTTLIEQFNFSSCSYSNYFNI